MTVEEETRVDISKNGRGKMVRNTGIIIVICSILILLGGETFSIWGYSTRAEYRPSSSMGPEATDFDIELGYKFSSSELHGFYYDSSSGSEYESVKYLDSECQCENTALFFLIFNFLLGILMVLGFVLMYNGHYGKNIKSSTKLIAVAALISFILIIYTFVSLPKAADEDGEIFVGSNGMPNEPTFYHVEEASGEGYYSSDEITYKITVGPSLGFFILLVQFGLIMYLGYKLRLKIELVSK